MLLKLRITSLNEIPDGCECSIADEVTTLGRLVVLLRDTEFSLLIFIIARLLFLTLFSFTNRKFQQSVSYLISAASALSIFLEKLADNLVVWHSRALYFH